jgi:hypothetical protein
MPYEVKSRCETCQEGNDLVIGLWPEHLGVLICGACRKLVNIPLEGGACPGCGRQPATDEFYDYAGSIPYLGGASLGPLEPGPECPRCRRGRLSFETTGHINVGHLGQREDGRTPWIGKEYLEKAIFVYALMAVCSELELRPDEILRHYRLDIPKSLLRGRRVSLPILMDIRSHLVAMVATGETDFAVTPKLRSVMEEDFGDLMALLKTMPRRRRWQFWRR